MSESYTDWSIVSLSPLSSAWTVALVLAVLVACALVLWSYRRAKRRALLMITRSLAALLVLGFLIEPALQLRVVRKIRNRLAVVVDRSRSMSLAADNHTRYDQLLRVLESDQADLNALGESHIVEWMDLEGPLAGSQLRHPPTAERTDLLGALERAREMGGGKPLAGIVLITDGADNAALADLSREELSEGATARLRRLEAPVNAVDVTALQEFKDVAVREVLSDEFAFLHNTLEIEVVITATGFGDVTVPVTLQRENDLLATQEVAVKAGQPATVRFKTKPDTIGEFVYSVNIPTLAGDAVEANNQRSFVIQVIRDKIRVLHVAGRPSWDERFLRQHLKENPNVDLVSFFILRTPTDDDTVSEKELSLIPFPVNKLFTTELRSFDVIIFQNFDHRPYNMAQYLPNIRDAVRHGLGFVMIGGDQTLGVGYQGTPLDEILPVRLDHSGVRHGEVVPQPTAAGLRHPVTDLTLGSGDNAKLWGRLPPWTEVNITGGLMPNATALVEASSMQTPSGAPLPLVAVTEAGEGRAMAIASASMWRWRFSSHRNGRISERAYHRFWSSALRWLVRDPEHSRVRVLPEKRRFDVGEPVKVAFKVLGQDYQPVPFARLRVQLESAEGTSIRIDDLVTSESGVGHLEYADLDTGAYKLSADANVQGEEVGKGRAVFVVESTSVELKAGAPRPQLLQNIAQATGGAYLELKPGFWKNLKVVDPDVVEVSRRRNIELWDNGWALALGVLLLAGEWAMRRRRGYL